MTLDQLPLNQTATITSIDWSGLDVREARRLQELGFGEGASVSASHRGVLCWRDPLAIKIGRMTVALRKAHAAAMQVTPA